MSRRARNPLFALLAMAIVPGLMGYWFVLLALGTVAFVLLFVMNIVSWKRERERRERDPLWYKTDDQDQRGVGLALGARTYEPPAYADLGDRAVPLPTTSRPAPPPMSESSDDGISLEFGDPSPPSPEPQSAVDVPEKAADVPESRWNRISLPETATASTPQPDSPVQNDAGAPASRWNRLTPVGDSAPEDRVRVWCEHCGREVTIAVRSGGQGICPSCWHTLSLPPSGDM